MSPTQQLSPQGIPSTQPWSIVGVSVIRGVVSGGKCDSVTAILNKLSW